MPFFDLDNPRAYCAICGRRLDVPPGVLAGMLAPPQGRGRKFTVSCECGEIWGFDNFPPLKRWVPKRLIAVPPARKRPREAPPLPLAG